MPLSKYLHVIQLSWQNGFVYRTSLVLWRLRQFIATLMALTVWNVVFSSEVETLGYTQENMISYIFLISILQSVILATMTHDLASRVYSGEISNLLLKPINFYLYTFAIDVADKLKNLGFIIVEATILFMLFTPQLVLPDFSTLALFVAWSLLSLLLYFFISLLFGALGFWSPDTWGPKFLFFMMLDFTAGKLFPLDILPELAPRIFFFTPFPYLSFVHIQLFLGRLTQPEILSHSFMLVFWTVSSGAVALFIWKKGLKSYAAAGH